MHYLYICAKCCYISNIWVGVKLLYQVGQLYWWRTPEKTNDLPQVTDKFYHICSIRIWVGVKLRKTYCFSKKFDANVRLYLNLPMLCYFLLILEFNLTLWIRIPLMRGVLDRTYVIEFVSDLRQVVLDQLVTSTSWESILIVWCLNSKMLILFVVFNATFNNISVISGRSVVLVEDTGENQRPAASHWQILFLLNVMQDWFCIVQLLKDKNWGENRVHYNCSYLIC
jgi:hypothetical protein